MERTRERVEKGERRNETERDRNKVRAREEGER